MSILDKVWEGTTDGFGWLRNVIIGEWADNRSLSEITTDAIIGFVPGVGSIVTLRDLIAIIYRLSSSPERRKDVEEWILLIAMLLPLIITVAGAAVAGVGALVGAELGGFLRALALLLVKKGGAGLKNITDFLRAHGYGSTVKALSEVKFAQYEQALMRGLNEQLNKLTQLINDFIARINSLQLDKLPPWLGGDKINKALAHAKTWLHHLEELRQSAGTMVPSALKELDQRLGALLSGNVKAATQSTHSLNTGVEAPSLSASQTQSEKGVLTSQGNPEPGNTRRTQERHTVRHALPLKGGKREYGITDASARPVGAKPYKDGDVLDNPPVREMEWKRQHHQKVNEGWPDLTFGSNYATFSRLEANTIQAGSDTKFVRVVQKGKASQDTGTFFNRKLPVDGQDLRTNSAVKDAWNQNGEYYEMLIPPKGHVVWNELLELRQQRAPKGVVLNPQKEEVLRFWEGPAASQIYKIEENGIQINDIWVLAGGKPQQLFDYEELQILRKHGFMTERKPTNFTDYNEELNNIVPQSGPAFEVLPADKAIPPIQGE